MPLIPEGTASRQPLRVGGDPRPVGGIRGARRGRRLHGSRAEPDRRGARLGSPRTSLGRPQSSSPKASLMSWETAKRARRFVLPIPRPMLTVGTVRGASFRRRELNRATLAVEAGSDLYRPEVNYWELPPSFRDRIGILRAVRAEGKGREVEGGPLGRQARAGGATPARACPIRSGYGGRLGNGPAVVGETGGRLARAPVSDASRETTATSTAPVVSGGGCAPANPG